MTAPELDGAFRFETSYDTRDARPNLTASRLTARRRAYKLTRAIIGAIGIACLFWRYTIARGIATLGLLSVVLAPAKAQRGASQAV
jgi:hypothetical protein